MQDLILSLFSEDLIRLQEFLSSNPYNIKVLIKIYIETYKLRNESSVLRKFFKLFCKKMPLKLTNEIQNENDEFLSEKFTNNLSDVIYKIITDEGFYMPKSDLSKIFMLQGSDIYNDLFFWSILANKLRLTCFLWYRNSDFCFRGLFASFLFKIFHLKSNREMQIILTKNYLEKSIEWEEKVGKLIANSFQENKPSTRGFLLDLNRDKPFFQLIIASQSINVASQYSCQITLQELWTFPLQETTSNKRVLISLLLPLFCPFIHTFVDKCNAESEIRTREDVETDRIWARYFMSKKKEKASCNGFVKFMFFLTCCFQFESLKCFWMITKAPITKFWLHNVSFKNRLFVFR